jgi:N-acetylneuraminic acid mutarotase
MTTDDDFDRLIQAYLESGPAELADRVLWAARAQLKTTRRRRSGFAWLAPWRDSPMTQRTRLLAAGGALVIAVAIGAVMFSSIFARPNPGPASSAAPSGPGFSATPSAPSSSAAPAPSSSISSARAPGWSATGGLAEARDHHTATLLSDGTVLVAGGRIGPNADKSATSAELYDPASGTWNATENMNGARDGQTATLLLDGRVLVAGGASRAGMNALATAELYDPVRGTWTATGDMVAPGRGHTATLLSNGRVLVVGGDGNPTLAQLYDPASGTWTATGRPKIRYHVGHTATLLRDGRVLVTGGPPNGRDIGGPTAELYDPASGSWTVTGNMVRIRLGHTATLLSDGKVLVAGGYAEGGSSESTASAEVYDPNSGSWTAITKMATIRSGGWTATLLTDGKVLVVGGFRSDGNGVLGSTELYDPGTGTWTSAGNLATPRAGETATLLPGGQVLVVGGLSVIDGTARPQLSAELYDPGVGN